MDQGRTAIYPGIEETDSTPLTTDNQTTRCLNEIVGSRLSSVEFVMDYIEFRFDGPCLTTLTLPSIRSGTGDLRAVDPGYRDGLCRQIGTEVADVLLTEEDLTVAFSDSVAFVVSLRDDDYTGPEAVNFCGADGRWIVF